MSFCTSRDRRGQQRRERAVNDDDHRAAGASTNTIDRRQRR